MDGSYSFGIRFGHALIFSISITAYKFFATHGVILEPHRLRMSWASGIEGRWGGMSTAILSAV